MAAAGLVVMLMLSLAHPQCLDFLPPFQPGSGSGGQTAAVCSAYSERGCCTHAAMVAIEAGVSAALGSLGGGANASDAARCRGFHEQVACAQCHPFAAHIFDAETGTARGNPGLEADFCRGYYAACEAVLTLPSGGTLGGSYTAPAWCALHTIPDAGYALPGVRALGGEFADNAPAGLDSICATPILTGVANPVAGVSDGSSALLYVVEQRGLIRAVELSGEPSPDNAVHWLHSGCHSRNVTANGTSTSAQCRELIYNGTGCGWTREYSCPGRPRGTQGVAMDDGTEGYRCCCGATSLTGRWAAAGAAVGDVVCCSTAPDRPAWMRQCRRKSVRPGATHECLSNGAQSTTYTEAEAACAAEGFGYRLCTQAELDADDASGCCGAGCEGDTSMVWTGVPAVLERPSTIWLDVSAAVYGAWGGGSERGLLSLAFHPNFAENGRFFLYYFARDCDGQLVTRLSEFGTSNGNRTANTSSADQRYRSTALASAAVSKLASGDADCGCSSTIIGTWGSCKRAPDCCGDGEDCVEKSAWYSQCTPRSSRAGGTGVTISSDCAVYYRGAAPADTGEPCGWTAVRSCPGQPTGTAGTANDDGSLGYRCCCNDHGWRHTVAHRPGAGSDGGGGGGGGDSSSTTGRQTVGDPTSERVILQILQPQNNHNGGTLLFDASGKLLITTGDGGGAGDGIGPNGTHGATGNGQNRSSWLGKVLRIDVDIVASAGRAASEGAADAPGSKPYNVPADNPFVDTAGFAPEIWAWGLRNPWRCSIDAVTSRVFCGDVGQSAWEEIVLIEKGLNFGWRGWEGNACYDSELCAEIEATPPIHAYPHTDGRSVTGGHVYRGCLFPNLVGKYIFGDYVSGRVWALTPPTATGSDGGLNGVWDRQQLAWGGSDTCTGGGLTGELSTRILSFGQDAQGELYILTSHSANPTIADGAVHMVVDPSHRADPATCVRATEKAPAGQDGSTTALVLVCSIVSGVLVLGTAVAVVLRRQTCPRTERGASHKAVRLPCQFCP